MMRIIVAGSRSVTEDQVRIALCHCSWIGFASTVISGTAKGADSYGERWATESGIDIQRFPADWEKLGKRAGPIRNELMAENAEGLIAVWDGRSRGTRSMIDLAVRHGLRIFVYRTDLDAFDEYEPVGSLANLWELAEERASLKEFDGGQTRQQAEREAGGSVLYQSTIGCRSG